MRTLLAITTICVLTISCSDEVKNNGVENANVTSSIEDTTDALESILQSSPVFSKVDAAFFSKMIDESQVQLVDVRTPEEYSEGTIAYAKNVDFLAESFSDEISTYDKNAKIYIFCQAGGRSSKARQEMMDMGFMEIYELEHGYGEWVEFVDEE